jgi:hypothetical protein
LPAAIRSDTQIEASRRNTLTLRAAPATVRSGRAALRRPVTRMGCANLIGLDPALLILHEEIE